MEISVPLDVETLMAEQTMILMAADQRGWEQILRMFILHLPSRMYGENTAGLTGFSLP